MVQESPVRQLTADRLEDSMVHGQLAVHLRMFNSDKSDSFKPRLNFQPAINGLRQTANQSAPEISQPDALTKEPQNLQRETDLRASGLTSQARPPSSQESCQEMVPQITTTTERQE